jgi:Fanconi anemia group J protein
VLNIWLMNPAVVFAEIPAMARSVLLTSGTLSPLDSFAGELGTAFPVHVEASHVIKANQVRVIMVVH